MTIKEDFKANEKQAYIAFKFQKLMAELLIKLEYINVEEEVLISAEKKARADIIFGEKNNPIHPLCLVEVKAYRPSSIPSLSVLNRAILQLEKFMELADITQGLVITSIILEDRLFSRLPPNIEIWDLNKILSMSKQHPKIYNELIDLFELDSNNKLIIRHENFSIGISLIEELKNIPKGKEGAYKFEEWCIRVLKYLFNDYLVGWKEQSTTIDGLHRRDLVCRVKDSYTEVWQFISHTLKSRYVIFEFKNYSEKITQREIFTTERYIYPMALRNCAFIISREGASNSAQQVIDGAMREHGKLIISLSTEDINFLLEGKDKGEDPNIYLFNKIDDFLISLSR